MWNSHWVRPLAPLGGLWVLLGGGFLGCDPADDLDSVEVTLRTTPALLDFGLLPVGGTAEIAGFVLNDGNAQLELTGPLTITGADADAFAMVEDGSFPVGPASSTQVLVRFQPVREGPHQARLVVPAATPAVPGGFDLAGAAEPASVRLDPEALVFSEVEAGLSETLELRLENLDEIAVAVPLAIEGRGFLVEGARQITIPLGPGEEAVLEVRFQPDRGGPFDAALRAELCGSGCGPAVLLSGTGLAPRLDVEPRPIDFSTVEVGASSTVEVRIANEGVGNLVIEQIQLNDASGWLTLEAPDALPVTLSGDDDVTLSVTYTPTAPDGGFSATLLVGSTDPLQPYVSIPIRAVTPGAALRLLPGVVNLGLLDPGGTRDVELLAISVGTVPVEVTGIGLVGSSFAHIGPPVILPLELAPTESILLPVRATASAAAVAGGGGEGTLTVSYGQGSAATASLAFTSGDNGCQPRATPANLNLGFLRLGEGSAGDLIIENIGTETCTGGWVSPSPSLPFDPGFVWQLVDTELAPGSVMPLQVAFTAGQEGQSRAFFDLRFAEREAPLLLSATATALVGMLSPQPAGVELGPAIEGCPGPGRTVSFVNDSGAAVTIDDITLSPPTPEVTIAHPPLPAEVAPGATFEVGVTPHAINTGLHPTEVVASTLTVGVVSAWVTSEVLPPGVPIAETFTVPEGGTPVDILFIVDNSGSMGDDQERLAQNFGAFIAAANAPGASADFHLAVTSTDVLSPGALRGEFVSNPRVMTASTQNLGDVFASHVSLGVDGAGLELGLAAMQLALDRPLSTSVNSGFHRPEAALSVIVVSDEDDAGETGWVADIAPQFVRSVDSYVEFLASVKGGVLTETPILFSAVVNPFMSARYLAMVDAFGGIVLDIGDPNWGTQLAGLGSATFGISARFRLANSPQPGTVSVEVNGVPTTAFTVDTEARAVVLDAPPPAGAVVVVTYVPTC